MQLLYAQGIYPSLQEFCDTEYIIKKLMQDNVCCYIIICCNDGSFLLLILHEKFQESNTLGFGHNHDKNEKLLRANNTLFGQIQMINVPRGSLSQSQISERKLLLRQIA